MVRNLSDLLKKNFTEQTIYIYVFGKKLF